MSRFKLPFLFSIFFFPFLVLCQMPPKLKLNKDHQKPYCLQELISGDLFCIFWWAPFLSTITLLSYLTLCVGDENNLKGS